LTELERGIIERREGRKGRKGGNSTHEPHEEVGQELFYNVHAPLHTAHPLATLVDGHDTWLADGGVCGCGAGERGFRGGAGAVWVL